MRLGDTRVVLEAPAGFADTTFTGSPRLQELAEALTSPSNRILLFALTDGDLRRFSVGDPPEFRRYMLVATPKALEDEQVSANAFRRLTQAARADFHRLPEGADIAKHLEGQPAGLSRPFAELQAGPSMLSLLNGTRLEPTRIPRMFGYDERPNYVLSTGTLLLVRGKALHLSVFTRYDSPQDLAWLRTVTERWIEDLQQLNHRP